MNRDKEAGADGILLQLPAAFDSGVNQSERYRTISIKRQIKRFINFVTMKRARSRIRPENGTKQSERLKTLQQRLCSKQYQKEQITV